MRKLMLTGIAIFVIFFVGGTLIWVFHDRETYRNLSYSKTFETNSINELNIDGSSNVTIKKGSKFKVKYNGDDDISVSNNHHQLNIKEEKSNQRGYSLDFNPFRRAKKQLTVEIPETKDGLSQLKLNLGANNLKIENIKAQKVNLNKEFGDIRIKNASLTNMDTKTKKMYLSIDNSTLKNNRHTTNEGLINVNKSQIEKSTFINDRGDIQFENMPSQIDVKGSVKQGNISFHYQQQPENTLLKLHPGRGESEVNHSAFKDGKVGDSQHILEFYTVDGDIKVK